MSEAKQYCSFMVEDLYLGVEVQMVQEVIRYQAMTEVPLSSAEIGGLINLRGQIVTAIDLRRRIGLPDRGGERLPMNVVIRTNESAVSLLVDEIGDVLHVQANTFEAVPETLTGPARDLISGVYKLQDRLLLVLDTDKAVGLTNDGDEAHSPSTSIAA